ncbi:unnamed protein product [Phytophthora lilii]|uniref:Unnamed protein product n=1 Tax=Phytophthora lilii TaxID=2077276 RepID=A0A9W6TV56_9STRA|nr:unnamed protein product [Phytophthora lilii]
MSGFKIFRVNWSSSTIKSQANSRARGGCSAREDVSSIAVFSISFPQIEDVDDVRNGLLLLRLIESAFDALDIAFIVEDDQFTLKILNPDIEADLPVDWHNGMVLEVNPYKQMEEQVRVQSTL